MSSKNNMYLLLKRLGEESNKLSQVALEFANKWENGDLTLETFETFKNNLTEAFADTMLSADKLGLKRDRESYSDAGCCMINSLGKLHEKGQKISKIHIETWLNGNLLDSDAVLYMPDSFKEAEDMVKAFHDSQIDRIESEDEYYIDYDTYRVTAEFGRPLRFDISYSIRGYRYELQHYLYRVYIEFR